LGVKKMKVNKKRTSRCPSCGERISIGERPKIGQYLLCSICDEKVEIINLDPIVLDLLFVPDETEYSFDEDWERY
jgi:lysine biosynthesis protein LysW